VLSGRHDWDILLGIARSGSMGLNSTEMPQSRQGLPFSDLRGFFEAVSDNKPIATDHFLGFPEGPICYQIFTLDGFTFIGQSLPAFHLPGSASAKVSPLTSVAAETCWVTLTESSTFCKAYGLSTRMPSICCFIRSLKHLIIGAGCLIYLKRLDVRPPPDACRVVHLWWE
jgi:hypothetical protein